MNEATMIPPLSALVDATMTPAEWASAIVDGLRASVPTRADRDEAVLVLLRFLAEVLEPELRVRANTELLAAYTSSNVAEVLEPLEVIVLRREKVCRTCSARHRTAERDVLVAGIPGTLHRCGSSWWIEVKTTAARARELDTLLDAGGRLELGDARGCSGGRPS
jgi:hypothetical protein